MLETWLRYDLRSPEFGTPTARLIATALEQAEWADKKGFHTLMLPEHHGSADGYNPSPLALAAAMAARTSRMRLHPAVILLPLHDPIRVAEDCCIVDNISNGRLDLSVGLGYVPSEFAMFGIDVAQRGRLADAKLRVLNQCFAGEPFEYDGRHGRVTPLPVQPGGPRIFVGGSVRATARRAAQYGSGYFPMFYNQHYVDEYQKTCIEYHRKPGRVIDPTGPQAIFVAEDPDQAWSQIAPHALHEANSYAAAAEQLAQYTTFAGADDAKKLRKNGTYMVLTPEECIEFARAQQAANPGRYLTLAPLIGGLSPETSWKALELFADRVIPALLAGA